MRTRYRSLISESHALVFAKLTKKAQQELTTVSSKRKKLPQQRNVRLSDALNLALCCANDWGPNFVRSIPIPFTSRSKQFFSLVHIFELHSMPHESPNLSHIHQWKRLSLCTGALAPSQPSTGIVQVVNFRRERARVKVTVQHDMEVVGHPNPGYANMTLTIVRAANSGRRPVTITSIGAYRLYPRKALVAADTNPVLPHELTEGKYVTAMIEQRGLDLESIESWHAWDAVGRQYSLNVAPWHKRWYSRYMRRKSMKKPEPKANSQTAS